MRRYLAIMLGVLLVGIAALVALVETEFTDCYAAFQDRETADQLATVARFAGFDAVEVEERGQSARQVSSAGQRQVAVTFTTGETGRDAEELRLLFGQIVRGAGGTFGHSGDGCLERGYFD